MSKHHENGVFVLELDAQEYGDQSFYPSDYTYLVTFKDGNTFTTHDSYRFLPILGEQDKFLFNNGTHYNLYHHLGAQFIVSENVAGIVFRVWAPDACAVSVVGNFNGWDRLVHQMRSLDQSGIWEIFIPDLSEYEFYRFIICTQDNTLLEKSDPFQFYGEFRPQTASVTRRRDGYDWNDSDWQQQKKHTHNHTQPISIYEVHAGSWKRDPEDPERFLSFRELAHDLIPYVIQMGFTHIELLPVMEHPLDESWGYQVASPFSITSRYGSIEDFKYFIDQCHTHNIGVILDWVPAHFPKDSYSLAKFDGTALYEHEDPKKGEHPDWGTLIFNYGRKEVSNFLIANALFWLDEYHIDGLRVDAVASMLYLDYGRNDGEWIPNQYGGKENLEAIEFIKHLNAIIYSYHPNCLMIAEESTSFYGVSKPTHENGLGFGYKWNMGWMNDTLGYFKKDPVYRKFHHDSLTFSLMYAFSENFILPLSHDEVVHGKRSLLEKMSGDDWQKFANLRLLFTAMWLHPGKKLLFMGQEFGQRKEWDCKTSLDWHLVDHDGFHAKTATFVHDLNQLYTSEQSLFSKDSDPSSFQWLDCNDSSNSVVSFVRYSTDNNDHLVCILNFTPQVCENYLIPLPSNTKYQLAFSSDFEKYGGSNIFLHNQINPIQGNHGDNRYYASLTLPPLGGLVFKPQKEEDYNV
jgi:1,4-alpha-glucan branching enzyme